MPPKKWTQPNNWHANTPEDFKRASANSQNGMRGAPGYIQIKTSDIPNAGDGAFALVPFRAGKVIGEYTGQRLSVTEANDGRDDTYQFSYQRTKTVKTKLGQKRERYTAFVIDSIDPNNSSWVRYVNSIKPGTDTKQNAFFEESHGKIWLFALTKIPANKEIIADYGPDYWKRDNKKKVAPKVVHPKRTVSKKGHRKRKGANKGSRKKHTKSSRKKQSIKGSKKVTKKSSSKRGHRELYDLQRNYMKYRSQTRKRRHRSRSRRRSRSRHRSRSRRRL